MTEAVELDASVLAQLRDLYSNADWRTVRMGIELAASLGDAYLARFTDGVSIDPEDDRLAMSPEWIARTGVRIDHRENAALAALSLQQPSPLASVERLDLSGCDGLIDLQPLAQAGALTELRVDACPELTDLQPLGALNRLRKLSATRCGGFDALPGFSADCELERLSLSGCSVGSLSVLSGLRQLRRLAITDAPRLSDLGALAQCHRLERLKLEDCPAVDSLLPLADLPHLTSLTLTGSQRPLGLAPLARLPALTDLTLAECSGPIDLSSLIDHPALTRLDLAGSQVHSLHALAYLPALTELDLPKDAGYPKTGRDQTLPADVARMLGRSGEQRSFSGDDLEDARACCALLQAFADPGLASTDAGVTLAERALSLGGLRLARRLSKGMRQRAGLPIELGDSLVSWLCDRFGRPAWLDAFLERLRHLH